jgi:hypothetical protein
MPVQRTALRFVGGSISPVRPSNAAMSQSHSPSLATFVAALVFLAMPASLRAERVPMSPANIEKNSTHAVIGKVTAIYSKTSPAVKGFKDTHYVAEVRLEKIEKGDAIKTGELIYARYWTREWVGVGFPPPDTTGYRGIPKEGETLRIHLTRGGYNGFGTTKDGGFTVLGPNGFDRQNLPPADGNK